MANKSNITIGDVEPCIDYIKVYDVNPETVEYGCASYYQLKGTIELLKERENYYIQFRPITPHVILFKCKKDGSESKFKQNLYKGIDKITKIELI